MDIEIRQSEVHGRGAFALKSFSPGDLVDKTPALAIPRKNISREDILWAYVFNLDDKEWILGLGPATFINSSEKPNVEIIYNIPTQELIVTAINPIQTDEEIFLDYQKDLP